MSCLIGLVFSSVAHSIFAEVSLGISQKKLTVPLASSAYSGTSCHGLTALPAASVRNTRKSSVSAAPSILVL